MVAADTVTSTTVT